MSVDGKDRLAEVSVIEMVTDLVTREQRVSLPVKSGQIACDPSRGLNKVAAIDRNETPCRMFTGFIRGFNLVSGAVGGQCRLGHIEPDCSWRRRSGYGECASIVYAKCKAVWSFCRSGEVVEELALPVMGIVSDLAMPDLSEKLAAITGALKRLGVTLPDPLLSLATLTGAAIPFFRISENGLVNLKTGHTKDVID